MLKDIKMSTVSLLCVLRDGALCLFMVICLDVSLFSEHLILKYGPYKVLKSI